MIIVIIIFLLQSKDSTHAIPCGYFAGFEQKNWLLMKAEKKNSYRYERRVSR